MAIYLPAIRCRQKAWLADLCHIPASVIGEMSKIVFRSLPVFVDSFRSDDMSDVQQVPKAHISHLDDVQITSSCPRPPPFFTEPDQSAVRNILHR